MREILWLKEAEDELATIVDYVLQNQGQNVALQVYDNIISQIDLLAEFPELGTSETNFKFKASLYECFILDIQGYSIPFKKQELTSFCFGTIEWMTEKSGSFFPKESSHQ